MRNVTYYNAGAGSGKTYTLTHQLAQRIQKGLNPAEVILTTFTKAAAADFRERARAVLYEEGLHEQAALLDQAVIGTVHSVGETFIRRYWYLLGLSPELNVLDEDATTFYINQSLASLPTADDIRLFRRFRYAFNVVTGAGQQTKPDEFFWKAWLKGIIDKATTSRVDDLAPSKAYSLERLKELLRPSHDFDLSPERFKSALRAVIAIDKTAKGKAAQDRVKAAQAFLQPGRYWGLNDFFGLAKFLGGLGKTHFKRIPELNDLTADLAGLWHSNQVYQLAAEVVGRVFDLAAQWRKDYRAYKQEHRIIDFNDMEAYFLQLLQRPDIAAEIRGRYKCLMVDEFQDSSPVQVDIFDRLSDLVEETYWCGDSKQAIYGFRAADTDLTEAVVSMIPRDHVETLGTSYRSEPDIVNLCNDLFVRAFNGKLEPAQVVLKPHREKCSAGPSLIHWASRQTSKDKFAASIAPGIRDFAGRYDIPYRDIAVLARTQAELDTVSNALAQHGIPVNHGAQPLAAQPETRLMKAILALVISPSSELAKATLAYLSEAGYTLPHLIDDRLAYLADRDERRDREAQGEAGDESEPVYWLNAQPLVKAVIDRRDEWRSQSVSGLVESAMAELNLRRVIKSWPGSWVQREANLTELVTLARQYEQYCQTMLLGATLTGYLDYLDDHQDIAAAGDSEGVVLSTYHGAKGLQWPNVILLSLGNDVTTDMALVKQTYCGVRKVREQAPSAGNLFPECKISLIPWLWGDAKSVPDEFAELKNSDECQQLGNTQLEESARLLYVGMTRAKDRLITTSYQARSKAPQFAWLTNLHIKPAALPDEYEDGTEFNLFSTGTPRTPAVNVTLMNLPYVEETDAEAGAQPAPEVRDIDTLGREARAYAPKYVAPSSTGRTDVGQARLAAKRDERIPLHGAPAMNEVGDCLHNIYAACTGDPAHDLAVAKEMVRAFNFAKVLPDAEAIIASRRFLTDQLTARYGAAIKEHHELPFTHQENDQLVRGSMDLVWQTAKGCILVDYKTYPGREANVTSPDDDHYAGRYKPQFDCYREALTAGGLQVLAQYVYYPVAGLLVQLD